MLETKLADVEAMLAADGYKLDVRDEGQLVSAIVTAGPDACEDCLVPKSVFRSVLAKALGKSDDAISLTYPGEQNGGVHAEP